MKVLRFFLSIAAVTLISVMAIAQDMNVHNSEPVPVLNSNTVITSQDQYFEEILSQTYTNFSIQNQEAYVLLRYDQSLKTLYSDDWIVEVTYDVTLVMEDGSYQQIQGESLFVDFYLDAPYREKDLKVYPGAIFAEVTNFCVNCSGIQSPEYQLPQDCIVEVGINSSKRFKLQEGVSPSINQFVLNTDLNQFELSWTKPSGAIEYELEWLFYELGQNETPAVIAGTIPRWNDAVRVQLMKNNYSFPNTYPKGVIAVRVRAIGENIDTGVRKTTPWSESSDETYGSVLYLNLQNSFSDLNWSSSLTFGENGRQASSIVFADELMRPRQSISFQNTDTLAIVHSNVYDANGRATVSILPAPQKSEGYKFYGDQLWDATSNKHFDYTYFDVWYDDLIDDNNDYNHVLNNQPLNSGGVGSDGPGTYYSSDAIDPNNSEWMGLHREYTPDAQGFPYSRTILSDDGSGRVLRSGGVGLNHSIDGTNGHVTSFYYGNPNQEELDSLFGNEVGYASQYLKTVSVDPDGQAHVAITDLKGRVVAEYLTGQRPNSLMALDHLTTVNGDIVGDETYVDLGVFNQYDPYADAMNAEHTFIVTEPSVHTFYYDLEENPFTVGCMGTAIYPTYNVYLDLYQTVDAADITAEEVLLITVAFEEQSSIDGDNQGYTATTPQLNPGTYRVVKRLELDQAGLETSISQFLSLPSCYEAPIQPSISCNDCWQHCFNASYHIEGTYVYLIDENGETTLAAVGFSPSVETLSAYLLAVSNASIVSGFESDIANTNALISNCEAECETPAYHDLDWCSFYLQQMVDDLSPGGQYFDNFPGSMNEFGEAILGYNKDLWLTENIATDPLNILSSNCGSFGAFDFVSSGISTWDDLRVNWVSFNEANPMFIDNWVTYHPEYCQYESRCGVELVNSQCSAHSVLIGTFDYWTYIDYVDSYLNAGNIPSDLIPILYNPLALQGFSDGDSFRSSEDGVGGQENDYTGNVQAYDCNPQDAYAINDHDWFVAGEVDDPSDEREGIKLMIEQNLRNFIHVDNGNYMSLWYVIDNPDDIGPLDGLPQNVLDLFDALHGPNGVFTQNPSEEFKLRFFHSVYRFFRDIAFLEYHENIDAPETCATGTCSPIAGGPSDNGLDLLGGGVFGNASNDFVLLFPQNALYNELTNGMWSPNSWSDYITNFQTNGADYILDYTTLDTFLDPINGEGDDGNDIICGIECSLVIEDAMEYIGATYLSLSSAQLSEIQSILEQLCANGCDVTMSAGLDFIGVANVTPVSFGGQSYLDINEVLNDYVVGYNDDLEFPVVLNLTETEQKIACNCSNLEDIIFGYNSLNGSSLDVNGIASDANFLVYLTENFYDPMDVLPTSIDLSDWTSECLGSYSNPLNAFPPNYNCESLFNFSADPPACEITLEEFELEQFQEDSQEFLEQQTNNFVQQYMNAWYENLEERESFRMKYTKMDYQATLYYYDQAGNLVKTVPPAGVRPLSGSDIDLVQSHRNDESGSFMNPAHVMTTVYSYNSIQQMIKSKTPDGGDVFYWYDDLDRIIASQNDKQLTEGCFSYTLYDEIGRPYESGQACGVSIAHGVDYDHATFQLLVSSSSSKEDVNYTWFDQQVASQEVISELTNGTQDNLRNRVSMVAHIREMTPQEQPEDKYVSATVFSYDIHGNAKEAIQEFPDLHVIGEGTKRIEYDYDVFSGNVHEVKYQWGEWDQFAHRYEYDADNRLHAVYTSSNGRFWENDAKYFYYANGPLARTEIADNQVTAQDYAYTIQGWVKGVNSATLRRNRDLGKDGLDDPNSNKVNSHFAEDSYGFVLDYFQGDFVAVTDNLIATVDNFQLESLQGFSGDLFDLYGGNISSISHGFSQEASIPQLGTMKHHTAIYRYDQLHRIKKSNYVITEMDNPTLVNNNVHPLGSILSDQFATTYSFDPNGNIETLTRNGHTMLDPADLPMDNFEYHYTYEEAYQLGQEGEYEKNRLKFVSEPQNYGSTQWTTDLDALTESDYQQQGDNYEYDEIGQMVKDANDGIGWIIWNAQNKVERVIRPDLVDGAYLEDLEFIYDQGGNRIAKIRKPRDSNGNMLDQTQWIWDYYARDPMGTELAIYSLLMMDSGIAGEYAISFKLKGEHINGSSRLGVLSDGKEVVGTLSNVALSTKTIHYDGGTSSLIDQIINSGTYQMQVGSASNVSFANYSGNRQFELSNHLGNVTAVLSDAKTLEYDGVSQTYVFKPRIQCLNDYYPFGMLMPGRTFAQDDYRYGFQGQETDDELKGEGNSVNYKYRMHDARIGRFFAVDPLAAKYPYYSQYAFSGNRVIDKIELEGLEPADLPSEDGQFQAASYDGDEISNGNVKILWKSENGEWVPQGAALPSLPIVGRKSEQLVHLSASGSDNDIGNGNTDLYVNQGIEMGCHYGCYRTRRLGNTPLFTAFNGVTVFGGSGYGLNWSLRNWKFVGGPNNLYQSGTFSTFTQDVGIVFGGGIGAHIGVGTMHLSPMSDPSHFIVNRSLSWGGMFNIPILGPVTGGFENYRDKFNPGGDFAAFGLVGVSTAPFQWKGGWQMFKNVEGLGFGAGGFVLETHFPSITRTDSVRAASFSYDTAWGQYYIKYLNITQDTINLYHRKYGLNMESPYVEGSN